MQTEWYARQLAAAVAHTAKGQLRLPGHMDNGGIHGSEDGGFPDPRSTAEYLAACAVLRAWNEVHPDAAHPVPPFESLTRAGTYLRRSQRESGLWDNRTCNYDSAPDTGFLVQALCLLVSVMERVPYPEAEWDELLAVVRGLLLQAAEGLAAGGHHTPNHRWVVTSALAWTRALLPEAASPEGDALLAAYRAEGIDINADGVFLERSIGVYDVVTQRALLLLAEHAGWEEARDAAVRNYLFNRHLLHADLTAETGLSTRFDFGTRKIPAGHIPTGIQAWSLTRDAAVAGFVHALDGAVREPGAGTLSQTVLAWIVGEVLRRGVPDAPGEPLPDSYQIHCPAAGIARIREGGLSLSLFERQANLLSAVYGRAHLCAMRIQVSYFGPAGHFHADEIKFHPNQFTMVSHGECHPRRPGYDLPLPRFVGAGLDDWHTAEAERTQRRLPHAGGDLVASLCGNALSLYLSMDFGVDDVLGMISFDFAPGGIWETDDTRLCPVAGQVLMLKGEAGTMRYGNDAIRIEEGRTDHGELALRDEVPPGGHVRVVVPFCTPVDHAIRICFL